MATSELEHTLLPKTIALPIFSSDPLSSNAYATQEILLVLGTAGAASLSNVLPISFAVALLLATVVMSYRQTVRAYPQGGGAYRVAHENLGRYPGLLAAAALLIDYVLTVSVSITAGVEAITSAAPDLIDRRVAIAIGFIVFVTILNLRGAKESGVIFAVPAYGFVVSILIMLATGIIKCFGGCPVADSAGTHLETEHALSLFLILRAFSAGTTALTGVEAISDGVPAFRYPQSKNAATTLAMMGVLSITMFLGLSFLADQAGVVYTEASERSVVADVADAVFGGGFMFYLVQVMTAGILILAANTAFQDFPRLVSILAGDRFMPKQLMNRGDRLVFSNGIVVLAVLAAGLVVVFDADLNRLIQLYLVGVFISFTLSQTGMVVHSRRLQESGWRWRSLVSGFGATVTGLVFFVVVTTKFLNGAWMVVAAVPVLMFIMHAVSVHYSEVSAKLTSRDRQPADRRPGDMHAVIFLTQVDAAAAKTIGYLRSTRCRDVKAITFDRSHGPLWKRLAPEIPLEVLERSRSLTSDVKGFLREERAKIPEDKFLTLVVPELLNRRGLVEVIRRPGLHRLKASMLAEPGIQVMSVPILKKEIDPSVDEAREPTQNFAVVLVSGVHNATLQAVEYAETLNPSDIRALSFGLEPKESERLGNDWLRAAIPIPLEMQACPFRDIGTCLVRYLQELRKDDPHRVVTAIVPEFVVEKVHHQFLHGQTALLIKRHLLFEPGIVVVSVPYHLKV